MKNDKRTRADVSVAVACGESLTGEQREFLDQNPDTAALAQDFEVLNLRLEQLQASRTDVPDALRSRVAEIPISVQPRRVPSRKLGYAFATVLAVAIVAGPFVSVINSRVAQKKSGPTIWDTTLKGKMIRAYLVSDKPAYVVLFSLTKERATIERVSTIDRGPKRKTPPSTKEIKDDKAAIEKRMAVGEAISQENRKFFDASVPLETGSDLLPFVTLEACKKAYGTGARVTTELRTEANQTWTEWTFEKESENRLVRVSHLPGQKLVTTINYMTRKSADSPYASLQRTIVSTWDGKQFNAREKVKGDTLPKGKSFSAKESRSQN